MGWLTAVSNGYKPPQNLYFIHYFYSFSVLSPLTCFDAIYNVSTPWKHAEGMSLRYGAVIFGDLTHPLIFWIRYKIFPEEDVR